jgi:peptide chain release factor subunit 1
MLKTEYS